ncbi:MAG: polysaccharide biosynthesis/export family protein, partial [Verrucomicrobiae bacterium]|nr:polysaccharide biosynthesis/export family protein [Verrucomicrobiae bacterium]
MRTFWHIPTALAVALTALVTFCTSGCSSSSATAKQPAQEAAGFPSGAESRLRAGDLLQVRVETSPNVPPQLSEVTVDEEGYIGLPLIGRIKAEGLTTSELADAIQKAYVLSLIHI